MRKPVFLNETGSLIEAATKAYFASETQGEFWVPRYVLGGEVQGTLRVHEFRRRPDHRHGIFALCRRWNFEIAAVRSVRLTIGGVVSPHHGEDI